MFVSKICKSAAFIGSISMLTLGLSYMPVHAANDSTTASLTINAGQLTMYAGDGTDNNDLCPAGNTSNFNFLQDGGSNSSVTCSGAEQSVNFSTLSVLSSRQNATTTVNDVLFEDLSGSVDNTYNVTVTNVTDLIRQGGGNNIVLGSFPDLASTGAGSDSDPDAPSASNNGKLFCTIDPSVGSIKGIAPGAAGDSTNEAKFVKGEKTTFSSAGNPSIEVFSTNGTDVAPGRYDIDNVGYKCRIPAYVNSGTYTQTITFTVTSS